MRILIRKLLFILLCISLLFSCTSRNLDDFRAEGKSKIRALTAELQLIRTRDDLNPHATRLEQLFNELASVMVEVQLYKESHPAAELSDIKQDMSDADQLRMELNRVLRLEGGREVIEKVQEAALNKLDTLNLSPNYRIFSK
jgi:hypothetical protein